MPDLRITLIQSRLHWEDPEANLSLFAEKIRGMHERTELVLLPEMFSTGFSMRAAELAEPMEGPSVRWMRTLAAERKIVLAGSLMIRERGHYYNRLIWMLPDGSTGVYDKRHLFAYAGEDEVYTPGHKRLIAQVKGWKICLAVCYDLRFPVWLRQPPDASSRYDLLVVVANWPQSRRMAWKTLLRARAIENQCYVAGLNRVGDDGMGHHYCGDSCIIDPSGEIHYERADEEDIHTATLTKERLSGLRADMPFLDDADPFMIL